MIRKTLITMGVLIGGCSTAIAQEPIVQDHTKTIIKRVPFNYEVCSEVDVPADKTKDTILGAIIGGLLVRTSQRIYQTVQLLVQLSVVFLEIKILRVSVVNR